MELELIRTYYPNGTNGELYIHLSSSIELPWRNNEVQTSCIPEGKYELVRRYSRKFGWHILIQNVKERDLILFHPANDALRELKGCIAPVSLISGQGKGLQSTIAFEKLKTLVFEAFHKNEKAYLTIKSKKE